MTRGLFLDPASGMAGDMLLGALLDVGLPLEALEAGLRGLDLSGYRLTRHEVRRGALRATKLDVHIARHDGVEVREARDDPAHRHEGHLDLESGGHRHDHGSRADAHAHGKSYREIVALIESSRLSAPVQARALAIFRVLAAAEARVHGVAVDDVHFHEVGAVDSIVDICGVSLAMEILGIDEVVSAAVGVGTGTRTMAHGTVPIPVPATAEIIAGMPVVNTGVQDELLTPTGAAILKVLVNEFQPRFPMTIHATGYGAGSTDRADPPNVVRARLYERGPIDQATSTPEQVEVLETQVDDMTGEALGFLRAKLEGAGALDVTYVPCLMKKGRPGVLVTVIVLPSAVRTAIDVLLRHSTTFGLRRRASERVVLDRDWVTVETPWGEARVKIGRWRGEIVRIAPEYEDCVRLSEQSSHDLAHVTSVAAELARERLGRS